MERIEAPREETTMEATERRETYDEQRQRIARERAEARKAMIDTAAEEIAAGIRNLGFDTVDVRPVRDREAGWGTAIIGIGEPKVHRQVLADESSEGIRVYPFQVVIDGVSRNERKPITLRISYSFPGLRVVKKQLAKDRARIAREIFDDIDRSRQATEMRARACEVQAVAERAAADLRADLGIERYNAANGIDASGGRVTYSFSLRVKPEEIGKIRDAVAALRNLGLIPNLTPRAEG
jgi:hypothetical protein